MTINERVRYLRKNVLHLNQHDFAAELHLRQTAICMIEKRTSISERNIADICARWGVREQWLRTGEGEVFSNPPPAFPRKELLSDPERLDAELAAALASLDEVQLKAFKRQFSPVR